MKTAIVIAPHYAAASSFSVYRGLEQGMRRAAELGYRGVELALADAEEGKQNKVSKLLKEYHLELPAISTGRLQAERGLCLSSPRLPVRQKAVAEFLKIIDLAAETGSMVNIGRARGFMEEKDLNQDTLSFFTDSMRIIMQAAQQKGVDILLEPVNRYECRFINRLQEGADFIETAGLGRLYLMPDLFHMNIEERNIQEALLQYRKQIRYIHFADSNRLAPGWGHLDLPGISQTIEQMDYDGWITVEILPLPDADSAAAQAIGYLNGLMSAKDAAKDVADEGYHFGTKAVPNTELTSAKADKGYQYE